MHHGNIKLGIASESYLSNFSSPILFSPKLLNFSYPNLFSPKSPNLFYKNSLKTTWKVYSEELKRSMVESQ